MLSSAPEDLSHRPQKHAKPSPAQQRAQQHPPEKLPRHPQRGQRGRCADPGAQPAGRQEPCPPQGRGTPRCGREGMVLSAPWHRQPRAEGSVPPQLMDLKLTVDGLEKERDFYFSKLRDIELICQEHENENSPIIAGIISVLYATEVRAGHRCPPEPPAHPAPWDEPRVPEAALASGYDHSLGCPGGDWALPRLLHCARRGHGDGLRAGPPPHMAPGLMATCVPWPGGLRPTRGRRAGGAAARGPGRVLAPAPPAPVPPRAVPPP